MTDIIYICPAHCDSVVEMRMKMKIGNVEVGDPAIFFKLIEDCAKKYLDEDYDFCFEKKRQLIDAIEKRFIVENIPVYGYNSFAIIIITDCECGHRAEAAKLIKKLKRYRVPYLEITRNSTPPPDLERYFINIQDLREEFIRKEDPYDRYFKELFLI